MRSLKRLAKLQKGKRLTVLTLLAIIVVCLAAFFMAENRPVPRFGNPFRSNFLQCDFLLGLVWQFCCFQIADFRRQ
jgi:hypothetical protein